MKRFKAKPKRINRDFSLFNTELRKDRECLVSLKGLTGGLIVFTDKLKLLGSDRRIVSLKYRLRFLEEQISTMIDNIYEDNLDKYLKAGELHNSRTLNGEIKFLSKAFKSIPAIENDELDVPF